MTSLRGLPDFGAVVAETTAGGEASWGPAAAGDPRWLRPTALGLARRAGGLPDFSLEIFRPAVPGMAPEPYGRLAMGLAVEYGNGALRGGEPVALEGAVVTWSLAGERLTTGADFARRTVGRLEHRLSLDQALLLRSALADGAAPLAVECRVTVLGWGVRRPLRVTCDPRALLLALHEIADGGTLSWQDLVTRWTVQPFTGFRCDADGGEPAREVASAEGGALAEALADRVWDRFAAPGEGSRDEDEEPLRDRLELPPVEPFGAGTLRWDLERPVLARRWLDLRFDPVTALEPWVAGGEGSRLLPPPTVVPPLPSGLHTIEVVANLPDHRPSVLALGVHLEAPPKPPQRPAAAQATVELAAPLDRAEARLRLSPGEGLSYRYRCFVVLEDGAVPRALQGESRPSSDTLLRLQPDDFPLRLLPVEAGAALLVLARVRGRALWSGGERTFELTAERPALLLALPPEATDGELEVIAEPRAVGRPLALGPLPLRPLWVDLPSLPGHGPQTVEVTAVFLGGEPLAAVELEAEGSGARQVVALTPQAPQRRLTYLPPTPFESRYRVRWHGPGHDWSPWRLPGDPLRLVAGSAIPGEV